MDYRPVVHRPLTLDATSYQPEYHATAPAAAAAAYQPASLALGPRPFTALPASLSLSLQQQPPMQPLMNAATANFSRPVVRPRPHHPHPHPHPHPHGRPYPAPYSDVLPFNPFNTQTPTPMPREAPVPAFYNYRPNEVKHRKRTTRAQTKILEEQFKSTDKPDAATRGDLSIRLGMTPREVQVWFQNRRAKEKKLRAQAIAALSQESDHPHPSTPENDPSSRAISPSIPATTHLDVSRTLTQSPPMSEPASASVMADSASRSPADTNSPSTIRTIQNNDRGKSLELISVHPTPTVPLIPTLPRVVSVPAIPFISTAAAPQSSSAPPTSITNTPFTRFLPLTATATAAPGSLTHRASLPHIRPAPFTAEQTHQRSASSPVFTTPSSDPENPSPPATVPSFSQTQPRYNPTAPYSTAPSYVFPSRLSQPPVSGPLPTPDFSFGAPLYAEVDSGEEDGTVQYAQYQSPRFGSVASVASSDSTSKSAGSLLTTDATATHPTFGDNNSSFAFASEQKRPSSSGAIPSASTSVSPWSGSFSSASPMSAASYGQTVSQPAQQESGLYVDYGASYESEPPVVPSQQTFAPVPTKANVTFQNAMYGYGDNVVVAQSTSDDDALVQYAGSEAATPFQSYAHTQTYDASSAMPQQPSTAQYTTQGLTYDTNALAMQQPYGYAYDTDLYNNQYGAALELYTRS